MLKKILFILLVIFIIAQFIRPSKNDGAAATSKDITHIVAVPENVMGLLQNSCYDCHSNQTEYPWYSKITPVNWWLHNHVKDGKRHLNFSEFTNSSYKRMMKKLDEVAETVEKHEMPLDSYLWLHKDAELDASQQKTIIDWARDAMQKVLQDSLGK
jgi:exonuclease VII small subunit